MVTAQLLSTDPSPTREGSVAAAGAHAGDPAARSVAAIAARWERDRDEPAPRAVRRSILRLWILVIGLHAVHQIEESVFGFYDWTLAHDGRVPGWVTADRAALELFASTPARFLLVSLAQVLVTSAIAYLLRGRPVATRAAMLAYLFALAAFFLYHVVTSVVAVSAGGWAAPVMVTSIAGLVLVPLLVQHILRRSWPRSW